LVEPLFIDRTAAARRFLLLGYHNRDYAWTPTIVSLIGELTEPEYGGFLPMLWQRGGLEDALIPLYARNPRLEDHDKFVVGLMSFDPEVVRISAVALTQLRLPVDTADVVAAIKALRRLPDDKPALPARNAVAALLRKRTGQGFVDDPMVWTRWLAKAHPELATQLAAADGFDPAAWGKRSAAIKWDDGDEGRGRKAFVKGTCAACHDGGGAVGPSLVGVGKRFGRDDLLTAILQPSRDVSPRYRPTRITTTDGKAYVGMLIYEATDGVILQTGPDATVRIPGNEIESKRTLDTSLMPVGLLDKLTDEEVADLMAYLRGLDVPR
jgi:putative heme-binding domain-containing protein